MPEIIQVGIVNITINAPLGSPKKSNTIKPVNKAPIAPSVIRFLTALITYTD